jgi:hypothetical protein
MKGEVAIFSSPSMNRGNRYASFASFFQKVPSHVEHTVLGPNHIYSEISVEVFRAETEVSL